MVTRIFKSKAEVISFVNNLGIEEAILLGNLWLEIKNKVTALEQNEILVAAEIDKQRAVLERENEILTAKNNDIKALEDSILVKDALILDKENEVKRWSNELKKLQEDKENERNLSIEQIAQKDEAVKQYTISLQKKDEEINSMRLSYNLERQEFKLDKDRSIDDLRIRNSKQNEENDRKIIELQSYIRAKEDELAKTRVANENFMMNKFEVTFGRFIEKAKTSAGTGLIGEEFVEQILSKIGFGIHYENVARWGHQGDFKIMFPKSQVTILLEVKNFAETQTSLPKKDIDKFFMDLNNSSYHAGILLSLNSQCKMNTEDLTIQDDPKSKKKFMFLSKFVSMVKGDHDFALKLALTVMANSVLASRLNQDDTSKEMLAFIKSQLEFTRVQYKAAQAAEREAAKTVTSFRDNINRITRQLADWETPKRTNRILAEFHDQVVNISPKKTTLHQGHKDDMPFGILAKPLSRSNSPWEKRNIVTGESSPKTPKIDNKRKLPANELREDDSRTPDKTFKIGSCKNDYTKASVSDVGSLTCFTSNNIASSAIKDCDPKPKVDDHGFLDFTSSTTATKPSTDSKHGVPESQLILPDDTDEIFKDMSI